MSISNEPCKWEQKLAGIYYLVMSIVRQKISNILASENNRQIWFELPSADVMKYILTKGFVAVDGISLTIGEVKGTQFCVNLIPETLQRTLMGQRKVGDIVNIEIDPQTQAIVDTVENYLKARNL